MRNIFLWKKSSNKSWWWESPKFSIGKEQFVYSYLTSHLMSIQAYLRRLFSLPPKQSIFCPLKILGQQIQSSKLDNAVTIPKLEFCRAKKVSLFISLRYKYQLKIGATAMNRRIDIRGFKFTAKQLKW